MPGVAGDVMRRRVHRLGRRARTGRVHRFRETEVEHLHRAVRAHLDVRRFQIAMDDALLVRGFERFGDLLRDRQRLVDRDRPARDALPTGPRPRRVPSRGASMPSRFFQPVDRGDVRMVQRREHFASR